MGAQPNETLALYATQWCPFCIRVRYAIHDLGIDVEVRDINMDSGHRTDLLAARGRMTVPVLRITDAQGQDTWMPESRDIIDYLRTRYG